MANIILKEEAFDMFLVVSTIAIKLFQQNTEDPAQCNKVRKINLKMLSTGKKDTSYY